MSFAEIVLICTYSVISVLSQIIIIIIFFDFPDARGHDQNSRAVNRRLYELYVRYRHTGAVCHTGRHLEL
jgi:hypothetical protein